MIDEDELLNIIHSYPRLRNIKVWYCRDFVNWFRRVKVNIEIVDYLDYVYQFTLTKKANSFEGLFISLSMNPEVFDDFCSLHKSELLNDVHQIVHINCPACGSLILNNETCPVCELEVCHRREPEEIRFHKSWANLTNEQRSSYESEMKNIITTIPFLERELRNEAVNKLKKKFNLID